MQTQEEPVFVGLKAILCVSIMFYHISQGGCQIHNVQSYFGYSYFKFFYFGADGFLLISGVLNAQSLFAMFQRMGFWEGFCKFMVRRFFRIGPIFYLTFAAGYFTFGCQPREILPNLFFIPNLLPQEMCVAFGWYANAAMQLLFITPAIIFLLGKVDQWTRFLILTAIVIGSTSISQSRYRTDQRANSYFLGILTYCLMQKIRLSQRKATVLMIFSIASLILSFQGFSKNYFERFESIYFSMPLSAFIIALISQEKDSLANRAFSNRFAKFISKISYSLYLSHCYFVQAGLDSIVLQWVPSLQQTLCPSIQDGILKIEIAHYLQFCGYFLTSIAVSIFLEAFVEQTGGALGTSLSLRIPKGYKPSLIKITMSLGLLMLALQQSLSLGRWNLFSNEESTLILQVKKDFIGAQLTRFDNEVYQELMIEHLDKISIGNALISNLRFQPAQRRSLQYNISEDLSFTISARKILYQGSFEIEDQANDLTNEQKIIDFQFMLSSFQIDYKIIAEWMRNAGKNLLPYWENYIIDYDSFKICLDPSQISPNENLARLLAYQVNTDLYRKGIGNNLMSGDFNQRALPVIIYSELVKHANFAGLDEQNLQFQFQERHLFQNRSRPYHPLKESLKDNTNQNSLRVMIDEEIIPRWQCPVTGLKGTSQNQTSRDFYDIESKSLQDEQVQEMLNWIVPGLDQERSLIDDIRIQYTRNPTFICNQGFFKTSSELKLSKSGLIKATVPLAFTLSWKNDSKILAEYYPTFQLQSQLSVKEGHLLINKLAVKMNQLFIIKEQELYEDESLLLQSAANLRLQKYLKSYKNKLIPLNGTIQNEANDTTLYAFDLEFHDYMLELNLNVDDTTEHHEQRQLSKQQLIEVMIDNFPEDMPFVDLLKSIIPSTQSVANQKPFENKDFKREHKPQEL